MEMTYFVAAPATPEVLTQWDAITAFFLPLLMSLILQCKWQQQTKALFSFVAMLAVSGVSAWLQGRLDPTHFTSSVFFIMTGAIGSYKALWQPTGIAGAIETVTSLPSKQEIKRDLIKNTFGDVIDDLAAKGRIVTTLPDDPAPKSRKARKQNTNGPKV